MRVYGPTNLLRRYMPTILTLAILQQIQQIDNRLLTLINFNGSPAYDQFWMLYTDKLTWLPLAVVVVWCLLRRGGWRHALIVSVVLCLLFLVSDFVIACLIKPLVARPRPSHDVHVMHLLSYVDNYRGGRYGFPSNHASNGFAIATMLTLIFRRPLIIICAFLWAIGSCYSRLYLGVHFPSDILAGAVIGTLTAFAAWFFYKTLNRRWGKKATAQAEGVPADGNKAPRPACPLARDKSGSLLISLVFLASATVLLLCSLVLQTR